MPSIDQMIDTLIGKEGRFSDNPADAGGATMWGITQTVARQCGYNGVMASMPRSTAADIYRRKYFLLPGFDMVYAVSQPIAEEMFDTGVNMGISVPGPWLQRILTALNGNGIDYADLDVDGVIGPATINALRVQLRKRGIDGEKVIVRALNCLQGARYLELTEKRPANRAFFYGWIKNRAGE